MLKSPPLVATLSDSMRMSPCSWGDIFTWPLRGDRIIGLRQSKIFHCADVVACGMLRVITTLEFLQHHFSEMGHRDLLVTQNLSQPSSNTAPFTSRAASAAGRLRSHDQCGRNPAVPMTRLLPPCQRFA